MERHSSIYAYLTSFGTALFGGITLQDTALYVGIITAIGTFVVNWYYKVRDDQRAEARGA